MSLPIYYACIASIMFTLALYGILVHRHILRKILAVNILSSSVFLFLVSLSHDSVGSGSGPDPIAQAMVITGIVVAVSATAFGLSLLLKVYQKTRNSTLDSDQQGNHSADT